jgi:hypothetical protein
MATRSGRPLLDGVPVCCGKRSDSKRSGRDVEAVNDRQVVGRRAEAERKDVDDLGQGRSWNQFRARQRVAIGRELHNQL